MPSESACRPIVQSPKRLPKPAWNLYVSIPSDSAPHLEFSIVYEICFLYFLLDRLDLLLLNEQILDRITASQGIIHHLRSVYKKTNVWQCSCTCSYHVLTTQVTQGLQWKDPFPHVQTTWNWSTVIATLVAIVATWRTPPHSMFIS